jgi:hypothetical protein
MELPPTAAALALGARPVSAGDPHLVVLGVLVAAWLIDTVLAAVEWWRGTGGGGTNDSGGSRVGTDGEPTGTSRDARAARNAGATRNASHPAAAE